MSVLLLAKEIVGGERQAAYGNPGEAFARIGQVGSAIIGIPVTAQQVAPCMAGLKLVRGSYRHTIDNWVDIAGYARVLELIHASDGACVAHDSNVGVAGENGGE